jgi:hypothetical protein
VLARSVVDPSKAVSNPVDHPVLERPYRADEEVEYQGSACSVVDQVVRQGLQVAPLRALLVHGSFFCVLVLRISSRRLISKCYTFAT